MTTREKVTARKDRINKPTFVSLGESNAWAWADEQESEHPVMRTKAESWKNSYNRLCEEFN